MVFWLISPGVLYTTKGLIQPSSISFVSPYKQKQVYRLCNVYARYVLYRALVVHVAHLWVNLGLPLAGQGYIQMIAHVHKLSNRYLHVGVLGGNI